MRKFIGFVSGMVLLPLILWGTTRHVYEADSAKGIQDSINASSAYDTVMVHTGTYFVRDIDSLGITMRDGVRLISPHPDSVTLSGLNATGTDTASHVIYCNFGNPGSHEAKIKGFTITDGAANGPSSEEWRGGGIYCKSSSPAIDSCVIKNNSAGSGGGLYIYNSSPVITGNTIEQNSAGSGGGLYIYYNSAPTITGNTIEHNSSDGLGGGGLFISFDSAPTITGNTITYNSVLGYGAVGGGLYISDYSSPTITGNTIAYNSADNAGACGGLYIYFDSSPTITGNTIEHNSAAGLGGGIGVRDNSSPTITGNTIAYNSAGGAGGIGISNFSAPSITGNTITDNSAWEGGALWIDHCSAPTITGNTIVNNIAKGFGGAIYNFGNISTVVVDSCFIVDNGSIYDEKSGLAYNSAGAGTLKISHSHLYYNTYQSDIEIDNNTGIEIPVEHNFWWFTDSLEIDTLFQGPKDFSPWDTTFIAGVPGEPTGVDSLRNYDNTWTTVRDDIGPGPDTLYLRIYGTDRLASLKEAAIAILKSSVYPTGIAVALVETDTNSGIYEGKASVQSASKGDSIRTDDIYQIIRVDAVDDTISITTNMDTLNTFEVHAEGVGVEETEDRGQVLEVRLEVYPNPFTAVVSVKCSGISEDQKISLEVYNVTGRLIKTLDTGHWSPGTAVSWDASDYPAGVYFVRMETKGFKQTKKLILMR